MLKQKVRLNLLPGLLAVMVAFSLAWAAGTVFTDLETEATMTVGTSMTVGTTLAVTGVTTLTGQKLAGGMMTSGSE